MKRNYNKVTITHNELYLDNTLADLYVGEVIKLSRGYGAGTTIQKDRRIRKLPGEREIREGESLCVQIMSLSSPTGSLVREL